MDPSRIVRVRGLLLAAWVAGAPVAALEISLGENSVTLSGVAPGGSATLIGVQRTAALVPVTTTFAMTEVDSDADGAVKWSFSESVSEQSFWAALDETSGSLALAFPAELELEDAGLDLAVALTEGPVGPNSRLEVPLSRFAFFLLRPGAGVWELAGVDGGDAELGEAGDLAVSLDLSLAEAIDGSGSLAEGAKPGDFFVGCSIRGLSYFAAEVTP